MSRFYEVTRKVDGGAQDRRKNLGTGETLAPAPVRQDAPPVRPGTAASAVFLKPRPAQSQEKRGAEWLRFLYIIRKHWQVSVLFAAVLMVTVVVVVFSMNPIYEPVARIEVDPPGERFSLEGGSSGNDAEYLETQAQNLKSDTLAIDVIHRLHLDQSPGFVAGGGSDAKTGDSPVYQLTEGEYAALHSFRANLKVKRDTASRLISVSFSSHDPKMAALVTNTVVNTFIDDTYRDQHDAIVKSSEWLARQLDDIRSRMEDSNRSLADFQKSIGVADVDANKNSFTERMTELNRQLTQAEADRIQLEALLKSVQAGSPDVLPEVRNNPVVQQLSTKLAELRGDLSQAKVIYGPNHPNVKKIQSQVDELQSQLEAQKTAALGSIRTSYAAARAREGLMDSQIKGASGELSEMARYNDLKREAQANSELYNNLYARVKEAGIAAASKSSTLRIVDEAHVLDSPTRPDRTQAILVGFIAALLGGAILAFVREQFDTRIFAPEDMRDWVGSHNIAVVPLFSPSNNQPPQIPPAAQEAAALALGTAAGNGKLPAGVSFLLDRPHSPEAEAVRSLHTSVMLSRPGNPPQVLLVVSSLPGEGKTTVAVNLAMAMAQHGTTCPGRRGLTPRQSGSFPGSSEQSRLDRCIERCSPIESRSDASPQCAESHRSPRACRQRKGWTISVFGPDAQGIGPIAKGLPIYRCRLCSHPAFRRLSSSFQSHRWINLRGSLGHHNAGTCSAEPRDAGASSRGSSPAVRGERSGCQFASVSVLPVRI